MGALRSPLMLSKRAPNGLLEAYCVGAGRYDDSMLKNLTVRETSTGQLLDRVRRYPRLRYMGSKYRLLPHLERVFADLGGETAVDAFSGSGVVSYLLKHQNFSVTSNDFLNFPATIARATVENQDTTIDAALVDHICGPAADDRDFIQSTFDGLYFNAEDRAFLDSAWSHIDTLEGHTKDVAVSALILSAARKQPRGVFTFTDSSKYADGRRDLQLSLREHFKEHIDDYNNVIFDSLRPHHAVCGDVFDLEQRSPDIVYLDPPYAPPSDDADYMKRYHFLEGLSLYWRGVTIMPETKTKKIEKKYTPFAYKRTIEDALSRTFEHFADSGAIVLSYSSNALPGRDRIVELLRKVKTNVDVHGVDHKYAFGTHAQATRRDVTEYIFVGTNS